MRDLYLFLTIIMMLLLTFILVGCSSVHYIKYTNPEIGMGEDAFWWQYKDISGRGDASERIRKREYHKIGVVKYNDVGDENKLQEEIIEKVKALGGDGYYETFPEPSRSYLIVPPKIFNKDGTVSGGYPYWMTSPSMSRVVVIKYLSD